MSTLRAKVSAIIISICLIIVTNSFQCRQGFDYMPPGSPMGICIVLGCSRPLRDQVCLVNCVEGYLKTPNNTCQVAKCNSVSKTLCASCEEGYQLRIHPLNPIIKICVPSNCRVYNNITRECTGCQKGFVLQNNGRCLLANCQIPSRQQSQCDKCLQQFTITKIQQGINTCIAKNCLQFNNITYQCFRCQIGFTLTENGICKLGIQNCVDFNQFSGLCYKCGDGYRIVALRACVKVDLSCIQYQPAGCVRCIPQYRARNGICQANFCEQVNTQNPAECKKCQLGYVLNSQKLCVVQKCLSYDQKAWRCLKCDDMLELSSVSSSINNKIIVQRCLSKFCTKFDPVTYQCLQCNLQYALKNGSCTLSNCLKPKQTTCQQCVQGWRLNQRNNCVVYDCLEFTNLKTCKSCAPQKRLYKGTCIKDNCLLRSSKGECNQCAAQFILHEKFNQFCVVPYCKQIDQSTGDCMQCFSNFELNSRKFCESKLCLNYQNKSGFINPQCKQCKEGYQPQNQYCVPAKEECLEFVLQTAKCIKCPQSYQLTDNSMCRIIKCKVSQKKVFKQICKQCNMGYSLDTKASTQKCVPNNCSRVENNGCKQCIKGFSLLEDICVADNCKKFSEVGTCLQCNDGFYFQNNNLTCLREKCLQQNKQTCLKCQPGFIIDQSSTIFKGLCMPINCLTVKFFTRQENPLTPIKCLVCQPNFVLMPYEKCVALDCNNIDQQTGLCKQCRPGFKLFEDGKCYYTRNNEYCPDRRYPNEKLFVCQLLKAPNCMSANPKNTSQCYRCENGFWLKNGTCRTFKSCVQQNPYLGCTKCPLGFNLNFQTGQCEGTFTNCQSYDSKSGQCSKCNPGHQLILYPKKQCRLIPSYCAVMDPWGKCTQCRFLNRVINNDGICVIPLENCARYNVDSGVCSACRQGFFLLGANSQLAICRATPSNCEQLNNDGECTKCRNNFIISRGVCFNSIQRCVTYNFQKCTRCQPGYFVDPNGTICKQMPRFCEKVILGSDGICQMCRERYVNVFGVCFRQIQFCINYDQTSGKCRGCQSGYSLTNNQLLCLLGTS